jgi:hypothetical protein
MNKDDLLSCSKFSESDTFYKMKQENATLFQKQTEKQNDDKLSDCLDNLFQEISTDL